MVLDLANSRMKDFFDVALLAQARSFDGTVLAQAIETTFRRRGTPLPADSPIALTADFFDDRTKQQQWAAFVRKTRARTPQTLGEVAARIAAFVLPIFAALREGRTFEKDWPRGGPWTNRH